MSGIAALKGYRTQFLYSLYCILANQTKTYRFRLEGLEDLDILDGDGNILFLIQVKNLARPITISDILVEKRTSFLKRFIDNSPSATPMLVSFGQISSDLKGWKTDKQALSPKEEIFLRKYKLTPVQWKLIKEKTDFIEVDEDKLIDSVLSLLKEYAVIDPIPTAENILYWLQVIAEKQVIITTSELFNKIEKIALYLSERIAISNQYGLVLKPLHLTDLDAINIDKLKQEFYYGINARYEHIYHKLDVVRSKFLDQIRNLFVENNLVIIHGASGQGKSALAYRYAFDYSPGSLIYELNVQEESVLTYESIRAIQAITKHINIPVLFLIHVTPNTTAWLKIVKEFANHNYVHFLVTIRNEDWYRAGSEGVDFQFGELELELTMSEAEMIYNMLDAKQHVMHYLDFKEVWISFGDKTPLLEFIYAITQVDSLYNRVKQQVIQLEIEDRKNNTQQLEFLRIVSLTDFFDAKVDVNKIKSYPSIQLTLEKFTNEYLIKLATDKKYVGGFHPIRSKILTEILFDEFSSCKKDYLSQCLNVIEDADVYSFLILSFYHQIIEPDEAIQLLKDVSIINWTYYRSVLKSLLWIGLKNYLLRNKALIDEVYQRYGDGWLMLMDIYQGDTLEISDILNSMPLITNEIKQFANEINAKLSPKKDIYSYASTFFNTINCPNSPPQTESDWRSFAEILFWLKQIPNSADEISCIDSIALENAFRTLDVEILSKLMLGMHYYSSSFNHYRQEYASYFIEKLRARYKIPLLKIDEEVHVDYIIDVLNYDQNISMHDKVLEIIDLIRYAFPDKIKYNTQAHGHKLRAIPLMHDETHKTISIKDLPLDEWTTLNATLRKLYEYECRPKDWIDFNERLGVWEKTVVAKIQTFNNSFNRLKNNQDYAQLVPVADHCNYQAPPTLKIPKSASDPLCVFVKINKNNITNINCLSGTKKETLLSKHYESFFKIYNDYKRDIENFITQSGRVVFDLLQNMIYKGEVIDEHLIHISQINLFNAIIKLQDYNGKKNECFNKFTHLKTVYVTQIDLFTSATIWKSFLNVASPGSSKDILTKERIHIIKSDFESRILKACKHISKENNCELNYINNSSTDYRPVFKISAAKTFEGLAVLKVCFDTLHKIIDEPDYTSLKQLMLLRFFPVFNFLLLTQGRSINNLWYEFPLYVINNNLFENLNSHHLITKPIDNEIIKSLNVSNWVEILPKIHELQKIASTFFNMRILVEHLNDLQFFENNELDSFGETMVKDHVYSMGLEIQTSLQLFLDAITEFLSVYPFDDESFEHNEIDQIYWRALINIKDNIFPQPKGDEVDYQININMEIIGVWVDRLNTCTESWGTFTLLLYDKYINTFLGNSSKVEKDKSSPPLI